MGANRARGSADHDVQYSKNNSDGNTGEIEMNHPVHIPDKDKWEFDERVTDIFENMLQRSIPQYDVMRSLVRSIANRHAKAGTYVIDLGCSRGDSIAALLPSNPDCLYFGIDVSEPMLSAARERFVGLHNVRLESINLRKDYPSIVNASVVLSVLTLQFIPIEYRQALIERAINSLEDGGCLILVEKVIGSTAMIDRLFTDIYYDLKLDNGYSVEEIERKRLSLEGVLVPVTLDWNIELLKSNGFSRVETFWRYANFAGILAIK